MYLRTKVLPYVYVYIQLYTSQCTTKVRRYFRRYLRKQKIVNVEYDSYERRQIVDTRTKVKYESIISYYCRAFFLKIFRKQYLRMIHTVVVQLLNSTTTVSCILSYENRYFRKYFRTYVLSSKVLSKVLSYESTSVLPYEAKVLSDLSESVRVLLG